MSKCPFWSSNNKRVNCYSDCPMYDTEENGGNCVFKEHITMDKIDFKGIVDYDLQYSKDDLDYSDESSY